MLGCELQRVPNGQRVAFALLILVRFGIIIISYSVICMPALLGGAMLSSIDIANLFIVKYGNELRLTNLSLNKQVYFAQVESLRRFDEPLFLDAIEAWEYGPVEPAVYHAFKKYGRLPVRKPCTTMETGVHFSDKVEAAVDSVVEKYGSLTAYDLVEISHREGGAWRNKYIPGKDVEITIEDIRQSKDFTSDPDVSKTLFANILEVEKEWSNTLKMLGDA